MCSISTIIFACALVIIDASLYDFTRVGECILGHNPWFDLLRHGCYCGFGNHGPVAPEDKYDECCQAHDNCYENLTNNSLCANVWTQYMTPYWFVCKYREAYCFVDAPWSWFPYWKSCGEGLCECDKAMMHCWADHQRISKAGPDKRHCDRSKSPVVYPHEPSWFEKAEALLMWVRFINQKKLEAAQAAEQAKMEEREEDSNAIEEGRRKSNRRNSPSSWTNDNNHIEPHYPSLPSRTSQRAGVPPPFVDGYPDQALYH